MLNFKVSVITISFNQEKFIKDCIESVLNQNYKQIEHIVIDPGSSDNSRSIIESYPHLIKIFENDNGPADGLNKGFKMASGDILCFINSDDFLFPNAISNVASIFNKIKNLDILMTSGYLVSANKVKIKKLVPSIPNKYFYSFGAMTFFQQGMFFKRRIYDLSGGFNAQFRTNWDGDLLSKFFILNANFYRSKVITAGFRDHELSITNSKENLNLKNLESKIIRKNLIGLYSQLNNPVTRIFFRILKIVLDPWYVFHKIF